jgi:hypothetical protein
MRDYRRTTNRRVSIEWCLIGDVNDDDRQADALAAIARRLRAHVNVIPMNPTPGVRWKEPSRGPDPGRSSTGSAAVASRSRCATPAAATPMPPAASCWRPTRSVPVPGCPPPSAPPRGSTCWRQPGATAATHEVTR